MTEQFCASNKPVAETCESERVASRAESILFWALQPTLKLLQEATSVTRQSFWEYFTVMRERGARVCTSPD